MINQKCNTCTFIVDHELKAKRCGGVSLAIFVPPKYDGETVAGGAQGQIDQRGVLATHCWRKSWNHCQIYKFL